MSSRKHKSGQRNSKHHRTPAPDGKIRGPVLTHMRNVAYDISATVARETLERAAQIAEGQARMQAAEEKRARKAARRTGGVTCSNQ